MVIYYFIIIHVYSVNCTYYDEHSGDPDTTVLSVFFRKKKIIYLWQSAMYHYLPILSRSFLFYIFSRLFSTNVQMKKRRRSDGYVLYNIIVYYPKIIAYYYYGFENSCALTALRLEWKIGHFNIYLLFSSFHWTHYLKHNIPKLLHVCFNRRVQFACFHL